MQLTLLISYEDDSNDVAPSTRYAPSARKIRKEQAKKEKIAAGGVLSTEIVQSPTTENGPHVGNGTEEGTAVNGHANEDIESGTNISHEDEDEEETPMLSLPITIVLLVVVTVVRTIIITGQSGSLSWLPP